MNRFLENTKRFITIVAIVLAVFQIILGAVWMCGNFFVMEKFGISLQYIESARTLVIDDYMGILYTLLIAGAQGIASVIPLPFYIWIYLLQLAASIFVFSRLIRLLLPTLSKKWVGFITAYLMTIPMIMQFILSVTPDALGLCLAVSLVCVSIRILMVVKSDSWKQWIMAGILYVLLGILLPDYFFIGGLFLGTVVVIKSIMTLKNKAVENKAIKNKDYVNQIHPNSNLSRPVINIVIPAITLVAAAFIIVGVNQLTQQPGSLGRMEKTFESTAMSRLAGESLATHYFFWPEEVKQLMEANDIRYLAKKSDNIATVFGPMVENAYGVDHAGELFLSMAKASLSGRTKEVVSRIATDLVTYGCFPFMIKSQLAGEGISVSGWNYSNLIIKTPILTRYYLYYGLNSFLFMICLTVLSFILTVLQKKIVLQEKKMSFKVKGQTVLLVGMFMIITLWNGLTLGGEADYRLALFAIFAWYLVGIVPIVQMAVKQTGGGGKL